MTWRSIHTRLWAEAATAATAAAGKDAEAANAATTVARKDAGMAIRSASEAEERCATRDDALAAVGRCRLTVCNSH
jgi:hypothetical protein